MSEDVTTGRRGRMSKRATGAAGLLATAAIAVVATSRPAAADACSALAGTYSRAHTTITLAKTVPAGDFVTPTFPPETLTNLPRFCRVAGYTTPTSDSHIGFEVWLPEKIWNGKFLQGGCGGVCGSLSYGEIAEPLRRGYAVAVTDDGHVGSSFDGSWAVGHPEKIVDFGWRAVKETTDVGKGLVAAYNHVKPKRSYFFGCSDGGREALMSAQRFPQDFDGIIAGAPANNWSRLFIGYLWNVRALDALKNGPLVYSDLDLLSRAVLKQCVGLDGGHPGDDFLNDPSACKFDPATLLCKPGATANCLSAEKVTAIKKISAGPNGLFPGYGPGGEASDAYNWPLWITGFVGPESALQRVAAEAYFNDFVFVGSNWTTDTYTIQQNAYWADVRTGSKINAVNPNLSRFKAHGGKLIQFHGLSDAGIAHQNSEQYYREVAETMGGLKAVEPFYRLFKVPGMDHCTGGPGANAFGQPTGDNGLDPSDPGQDILSALDAWVEKNQAPSQIIATKYVDDDPTLGVDFRRPICAYPKMPRYAGGPRKALSSWICATPGVQPALVAEDAAPALSPRLETSLNVLPEASTPTGP